MHGLPITEQYINGHSFVLRKNEWLYFSGIFNNISAISWRSVLLMGETGVPGENHRPISSH